MPDIFLSYTREDLATAQRFAEAFEAQGFSVWWDATLRSGEAYDQVTEEALRTAKAVVVLWSKKSVVSRWVRAEATLGDRHRTLVPAMIEPCERPIMFELTQTADLCQWTGDTSDPAWRGFLADVRRFVEAQAEALPPRPRPSPQIVTAAASQSAPPSIAVLPFINRSGRKEDDVFADGMVEDLTAALSSSDWAHALASSATAIYRTGSRDLRQIGRDLAVRYLLEGNVRRVGDSLRVTAQFVEAESGKILWTQKFDRPLAELSGLQEDLVTELAAHLGVQVHRAEMEHALKKPGNISAYEALMRANAYFTNPTATKWEAAIAEARRAVTLDPEFGRAYALLAAFQAQAWLLGGGINADQAREIAENVRRARALDPNDPHVISASAGALAGLGRLRDALQLAERAAAIAPRSGPARFVLGVVLAQLGRWDEGIAELEIAESIGPNGFLTYTSSLWRSVAHLEAGRMEQAIEAAEHAIFLFPGPELLIQSMLCLAVSGERECALETVRRLQDVDPDMSRTRVEQVVNDLYKASAAARREEYIRIVHDLWDEAASDAKSE